MKKLFDVLMNLVASDENFIERNDLILRICFNDSSRQGCSSKCDKIEEGRINEWHFEKKVTFSGKINIHYWDDMLTDININVTYDQWHLFTRKLQQAINKRLAEMFKKN